MSVVLEQLMVPIVQAPMAGVSTAQMVAAVANAGGLGFLAAGYKSAAQMSEQIVRTRQLTDRPFAVNLFTPQRDLSTKRAADISAYAQKIARIAAKYGVEPGLPVYDDDDFEQKIDQLIKDPVAMVTFTFGAVQPNVVQRLRAVGTEVGFTVTSVVEARWAETLGADLLVVQGCGAGGHRGTWDIEATPNDTDTETLVTEIAAISDLGLIGAGGVGDAADVAQLIGLGCAAVAAGTAFVATDESTAPAVWKQAFTSGRFDQTVTTRAFSGRVARALTNRFIEALEPEAPMAYPQLHYLTRPIRAAAGTAGDPDGLAMWAGTGFRHAVPRTCAQVVSDLAAHKDAGSTGD